MTYLTSYLDLTYFNRSSFLWSYGIGKLPSLLSSVLRSASKTSSSPVLLAGPFRKSGQRCRKFFFIQRGNREPVWRVPSVGELPPKFWRKSDLFFFFFCFSLFDLKHIRWILVLLLSLNSEKPNVQSHLESLTTRTNRVSRATSNNLPVYKRFNGSWNHAIIFAYVRVSLSSLQKICEPKFILLFKTKSFLFSMNSSSTLIYSKETKKMEVYQFECCKIYNTKTPSNERWKETKHISVKLLNYQPTNLMKLLWLAKKCISSILYLKKPQSRVPRDSKDLLLTPEAY